MPKQKLPTERNTPSIQKRILTAARKRFHTRSVGAVFEHGHWWVEVKGRFFDVVDAEGRGTIDGFDFEEV